ncbi:MAG: hypothetical protein Q7S27_02485 [Nanoarchaeota archaeon]|nr:hypothetical protein [Nanoarchaeota archaeon]
MPGLEDFMKKAIKAASKYKKTSSSHFEHSEVKYQLDRETFPWLREGQENAYLRVTGIGLPTEYNNTVYELFDDSVLEPLTDYLGVAHGHNNWNIKNFKGKFAFKYSKIPVFELKSVGTFNHIFANKKIDVEKVNEIARKFIDGYIPYQEDIEKSLGICSEALEEIGKRKLNLDTEGAYKKSSAEFQSALESRLENECNLKFIGKHESKDKPLLLRFIYGHLLKISK